MSDEYDCVSTKKLKLKIDDSSSKKKKKKSKEKKKLQQAVAAAEAAALYVEETTKKPAERKLTKAEQSFKQMQEKMQTKRITEKASLTHKQRVEKFNEHLDSLTEHFDIPKVSWTK
ncbi:protein FAM32A-like [Episyrphus balteatus]|uniref:protein FAM32A-like n=1 Tax=Episyrphus balteatus TaxID=286459 RepID=UPI0024853018|nr:protein FAM32A-like [Episyrphus balteatus]